MYTLRSMSFMFQTLLSELGGQEDQLPEGIGSLGHPRQICGDHEPQDANQGRNLPEGF